MSYCSLKLDLDDKSKTAPVNLSTLKNVVKNDVVKRDAYDEFVKKVNAVQTIDTSGLVKKTDYDKKLGGLEGKYM